MGWDSFPIPNSLGNAWKFHLTPGPLCALKQSPVWSDCSPVGRQAAASSRVIDWINSLIPNRWIEYWCLVSPHHRRKTQSASTAPKFNPLLPRSPLPGAGCRVQYFQLEILPIWMRKDLLTFGTLCLIIYMPRDHRVLFCKKPSFSLFPHRKKSYQGPLLFFLLSFPTCQYRECCMLKIHQLSDIYPEIYGYWTFSESYHLIRRMDLPGKEHPACAAGQASLQCPLPPAALGKPRGRGMKLGTSFALGELPFSTS